MPGYNTHRRFNYAVFVIIAALFYFRSLILFEPAQLFVLGAGFYAGTEFITPDLDIESKAIKRWGALRTLWLPYKLLFKHGKSSHNIVYGAVVRLLYIGIIILGVYYVLFRALPSNMMILPLDIVLIFLTGIIIANSLHVILDMIF
ncbi:MAG: metal-binding protein [Euryarchaeota archaeon]|nr:metal-binding protein [Euryarchaeota archaeon]